MQTRSFSFPALSALACGLLPRAALCFSLSLTSCTHDYRAAKQTLKAAEIDTWAKPIQPEALAYEFEPLIPRTKHELERQAEDEQTALDTLRRIGFR
jgi:response regulator of citrate/malate metabolism